MKNLLYLTLIIQFTFLQVCFSQKIDWTIYDLNYTKILEIKNTQDITIQDDLIWYKKAGKYGIMDMNHNILVKPKYQTTKHHQSGFTSVGIKGCFSMVYKGKEILPFKYAEYFQVDSSECFRAQRGCSEDEEAYIITTASYHDKTGKVLEEARDINLLSISKKISHSTDDRITVSNGFKIGFIYGKTSRDFTKKVIYNVKDSLIFSCTVCNITDNINGEFFIHEKPLYTSERPRESYIIDTTGLIKIRNNYDWLRYDKKYKRYLYQRGDEHGILYRDGRSQFLVNTHHFLGVQPLSKNRFWLLIEDSLRNSSYTISDSLGAFLFPPTKFSLYPIGENCLEQRSPSGYKFMDINAKVVSNTYDSIFPVPKFDYKKMVSSLPPVLLGFCGTGNGRSELSGDGHPPNIEPHYPDLHYVIKVKGKEGLFNVNTFEEVHPQYDQIAKVNEKLFAVKKEGRWFAITDKGLTKSFKKGKYINFFEDYILIGN